MTCPRCIPMCATTEAQLKTRTQNMERVPSATPHPCPACGSIEWATTREMIREEQPERWWRRPPSWSAVRVMNVFVIVLCTANVFMTSNVWLQLANAFIAGTSLGGMVAATMMIRMMASFERMKIAFDELHELNRALIENRVKMHIAGMEPVDDEPPLAPRLH